MIKVGINGACGRMGLRLVTLISQQTDMQLTLAMERSDHPAQGKDVGIVAGFNQPLGVLVTDQIVQKNVDIILDFSTPRATISRLLQCKQHRIAFLIGTSGLTEKQIDTIKEAAKGIPCLVSPTLSRGAILLLGISRTVAKRLGKEADIEIVEMHHRTKKDAPSGTALRLREEITAVLKDKNIPIHSLRIDNVVGEHKVVFGIPGERVELAHRADSRDAYAQGALEAARFLVKASSGFYTLDDLLGRSSKI